MQLILVLGDQLTPSVSSLRKHNDGDVVLMVEVREEATYVKHHKKKSHLFFRRCATLQRT
ncbi:cryptochrome/photolyase family protein [Shimia sp. MMG029]|nr:cryptochrome/photolyase family protein [Shimia sp. MMG029]MDA5557736.1 cryptochrome/photolyase family protein [Shimia sp. MMG029]